MGCDWYSCIKLIIIFKNSIPDENVKYLYSESDEIILDYRRWYAYTTYNSDDDLNIIDSSDNENSDFINTLKNMDEYINLNPTKTLYENDKWIKESYYSLHKYLQTYDFSNILKIIKIACAWINPNNF